MTVFSAGALAAVLVATAVGLLLARSDRAALRRALLDAPGPVASSSRRVALSVDDVASTMVLLAMALRSGCGVVEAIEAVAATSVGRVRDDLRAVAAAHRWGVLGDDAWVVADPGWARVARALTVATRAGMPPSGLLLDAAADLRADEVTRLEVAGADVGVRMVLPLGLAFLPAFCLTSVVPLVVALARQVLAP